MTACLVVKANLSAAEVAACKDQNVWLFSSLQCCMSAWREHEGMQVSGLVWAASQEVLATLLPLLLL